MRHLFSFLIPILLVIVLILNQALPADAAKGKKKKGLNQEVLTEITVNIDDLVKKSYRRELYTPEDADKLMDLKIKLDSQMDILPQAELAPLYYKIGTIFKLRGEEKNAIICYQTILENFYQTAYGPKSRDTLSEMGIEIKLPEVQSEENEENKTDF